MLPAGEGCAGGGKAGLAAGGAAAHTSGAEPIQAASSRGRPMQLGLKRNWESQLCCFGAKPVALQSVRVIVSVTGKHESRQRQSLGGQAPLQGLQTLCGRLTQRVQVEAEQAGIAAAQATQTLTQKHRGTPQIGSLKMDMGDGDLKNALQHPTARALGFMPELFKTVVTGIPAGCIEQAHRLLEAGVGPEAELLRVVPVGCDRRHSDPRATQG